MNAIALKAEKRLRIPFWIQVLLIVVCLLPLVPLLELMTWRTRNRLKKIKRRGRK